jgi:ABC-type sugar transport system permease subunit/ABC-type glycerol-3-phosphate transport system substrate-binding protein
VVIALAILALLPTSGWAQSSRSDRISVEIPIFEGGEGMDFFFQAARAYEAVYPRVAVDLYGDPRIADKVRVRVLEGSFPDITNAGLNYWALIRTGDVMPLDEVLEQPNWEKDSTWRDSFMPGALDRYTWEGHTYGIPFLYSIYAIWYNKTMFEEQGWEPPETWDAFLALCKKVKDAKIPSGYYNFEYFSKSGTPRPKSLIEYNGLSDTYKDLPDDAATQVYPLSFQGQYHGYAQGLIDSAYYYQAGLDRYLAQKNIEAGSFDNPELIKSLSLVQELATQYFEPGCMGHSHTMAQQRFFNGKTAMIPCGSWLKSEMLGKIPDGFRLGAFNLPHLPGKGDPTAVYTSTSYYFAFRKAAHSKEGLDFLRFMTSRAQAGKFCKMRDIIAAVKGSAEGNVSDDMLDVLAIATKAHTSYGAAPGEGFPEFDQYWSDARFAILTGAITPEKAAKDLEDGAEQVRNRAANPDEITVRHRLEPGILLGVLGVAMLYTIVTTARRWAIARRETRGSIETKRVGLSWLSILIFVGPAGLLYTAFVVIPSARSFWWSTQRWDGLTDMTYVGLQHFKRLLFESDPFWIALKNNLFIMLVIPLFVIPLSLFLAACISRGLRGSTLFRIVFFFPNILGAVAATLLWMHLYEPNGGPVNRVLIFLTHALHLAPLLKLIGVESFEGFAWLSQEHLYWALIPMSIWGACGFNMLLYLAAMEGIPHDLYEAAEIDGASAWRQFWTITLPLIWDVLSISIVFMIIGGMKAFEGIWLLTNQRPTTETHVIGTRMVQAMFTEFNVGEATAIAVLLFLMVFFGTAATLRLMRRETVEY